MKSNSFLAALLAIALPVFGFAAQGGDGPGNSGNGSAFVVAPDSMRVSDLKAGDRILFNSTIEIPTKFFEVEWSHFSSAVTFQNGKMVENRFDKGSRPSTDWEVSAPPMCEVFMTIQSTLLRQAPDKSFTAGTLEIGNRAFIIEQTRVDVSRPLHFGDQNAFQISANDWNNQIINGAKLSPRTDPAKDYRAWYASGKPHFGSIRCYANSLDASEITVGQFKQIMGGRVDLEVSRDHLPVK